MDKKDLKLINEARKKFDAISDQARERLYKMVLDHFQKHPNSPWSGAPLVDFEKSIKGFYEDLGVKYRKCFRNTLPETMQTFYDRATEELKTAGVRNAILGKPDSGRVKYFLDSTFEQVAMRTHNMSFQHIQALRSLSAEVMRQMSITGESRKTVSRELLNKAMEIRGFEFIDAGGRTWKHKSYFNMLARTELMNAARASYDDKCAQEGCDVMMLDYSGNCCDKCAKYEGELFSLTGTTAGLPTKDDLIADGVFHPNCTHSYTAVPDYVRDTEFDNMGYKKEPYNWVKDIDKLQEFQQEWGNELKNTPKEIREAVEFQTSMFGQEINEYLRTRKNINFTKKELETHADKLSKLFDKVKNKKDITVYRCVDDFSFIPKSGEFVDKGFSSCSITPKLTFGENVLEINAPKGCRGAFIQSLSTNEYEKEFLLDKNTKYHILKKKKIKIYDKYFDCIALEVVL